MKEIKPLELACRNTTLLAQQGVVLGDDGIGGWKHLAITLISLDHETVCVRMNTVNAKRLRSWLSDYISRSEAEQGIQSSYHNQVKAKNVEIARLNLELKEAKQAIKQSQTKEAKPTQNDAELRILRAKVSSLEADLAERNTWIEKAKKYLTAGGTGGKS